MKRNILINLTYVVIIFTIIGQCVVGGNFYIGQFAYLIANCINTVRDFALNRPAADKVKNTTFLAITIGIILFNYLIKR